MRRTLLVLFFLTYFAVDYANAQGGFDLIVVDTEGKGKKLKVLTETAKPLTNRPQYDNQPSFINDSELVFSAADEKGNHDIILYSFPIFLKPPIEASFRPPSPTASNTSPLW